MRRFTKLLAISAVLAAGVLALCVATTPAAAQLGGGLGGGGAFESLAGEIVLQSGGAANQKGAAPTFFLVVSTDGSRVWGYSVETGKWQPAPLDDADETRLGVPVLGGAVGFITEGRRVHAFSSLEGEWDTLQVPEKGDLQPVVGTDYAEVRTKSGLSLFSARTAKWATVKFADE
jgi:hypothetical protein